MKQVQQNYRNGVLKVADVPAPAVSSNALLVATRVSLISSGTERQLMQLARSSLLGKAKARPDLVRRVLSNVRKEGLLPTLNKVFAKLDTPIPLGYSLVGEVIGLGNNVRGYALGDRVACAGAGFANHAEINAVPKTLCVKVPESLDDADASFVTLGAIALQGVRQAEPTLGETFVVMGLGLIGLLSVQILKANGCRVIGYDPDITRVALAQKLGADVAVREALSEMTLAYTQGYGADGVIVAASTKSHEPINQAAEISRLRGRVIVVGLVGMNIDREPFYKRELTLKLSMSYGPGRGDPAFEIAGQDYPLPYVRWTEQRNMEAFLGLIAQKRVTPQDYVTHSFTIDAAEQAYDLMERGEPHLAILLTYPQRPEARAQQVVRHTPVREGLGVAFIGMGNYARASLVPRVKSAPGIRLTAVVTKTGLAAHHAGETLGFAVAATDVAAALGEETQAVFIATRHDTHAALTVQALRAGKHVFCEKPLALTHETLEDVIAAAQTGPILTVGFNRRFAPLLMQAKQALTPRSGPLMMIYRVNAGAIPSDNWVQREEGGGRILGEVCHFVDSLTYLCGSLPVEVQAARAQEDAVSVLLRFADGSVGTIVYTALGDPSCPKEYIEAFATGRVVILQDFTQLTIHAGGKIRRSKARQDKGQGGLITAFLAAAQGQVPPPIPLEELEAVSRATLMIEDALRE